MLIQKSEQDLWLVKKKSVNLLDGFTIVDKKYNFISYFILLEIVNRINLLFQILKRKYVDLKSIYFN